MKLSLPLFLAVFSLASFSNAARQTVRPSPHDHKTSSTTPSNPSPSGTKVLFHAPAEFGCNLSIDGEKIAGIDADQIFATRLEPGEHLLQCVNMTRTVVPLKWATTRKIERGDQVVIQIHAGTPSITASEAASYVRSGRLTLKTGFQAAGQGMCDNGEYAHEDNSKCAIRDVNIPANTVVSLASNEPKQIGGSMSFLISVEGVRLWYAVFYFTVWDGSIELSIKK